MRRLKQAISKYYPSEFRHIFCAYLFCSFHHSPGHQSGLVAALLGHLVVSRRLTVAGSRISLLQRISTEPIPRFKSKLLRYDQRLCNTTLADAPQLMRGKRNFTRTAVHAAPRPFLFVALSNLNSARLTMHLVRCTSDLSSLQC